MRMLNQEMTVCRIASKETPAKAHPPKKAKAKRRTAFSDSGTIRVRHGQSNGKLLKISSAVSKTNWSTTIDSSSMVPIRLALPSSDRPLRHGAKDPYVAAQCRRRGLQSPVWSGSPTTWRAATSGQKFDNSTRSGLDVASIARRKAGVGEWGLPVPNIERHTPKKEICDKSHPQRQAFSASTLVN